MTSKSDSAYATKGLPPPPEVSVVTKPMAGLLVDVYGVDELPPSPSTPTTCLWLLHPRTRTRARMRDVASRALGAYHQTPSASGRGLIALAFDMPNHGTRLVSDRANVAWDKGNDEHAIDMMAMVKGAVADMAGLMDVVGGYVGRRVDAHVCLGWSLGGHAAWQAWAGEPRIDAAVVVVGCPDFAGLMSSRAKKAGLDCGDGGFLGSRYFPEDLVTACAKHDPKAILFGDAPLPTPPLPQGDRARLAKVLGARGLVGGKKLLLCSGADDKLVPYANGAPFVRLLEDVGGVNVEDKLYQGVGHSFSSAMVEDAVRFLVDAVQNGPRERARI